MGLYLEEHPNRTYKQYRAPRREKLSGVLVIHTAENTPDFVAFDGGAEAVASWISRRPDPGSYHTLVDSDSTLRMIDFNNEAFHDATSGGNRHEIGLSVATRADVWPLAPKAWRDGAVEQLAHAAVDAARFVQSRTGIIVPARMLTRAESEQRIPGFISHALRDPKRRTDPGAAFPWQAFFARYAALMGTKPTQPTNGSLTMSDAKALQKQIDDAKAGNDFLFGVLGKKVDRLAKAVADGAAGDRMVYKSLKDEIEELGKLVKPADGTKPKPNK